MIDSCEHMMDVDVMDTGETNTMSFDYSSYSTAMVTTHSGHDSRNHSIMHSIQQQHVYHGTSMDVVVDVDENYPIVCVEEGKTAARKRKLDECRQEGCEFLDELYKLFQKCHGVVYEGFTLGEWIQRAGDSEVPCFEYRIYLDNRISPKDCHPYFMRQYNSKTGGVIKFDSIRRRAENYNIRVYQETNKQLPKSHPKRHYKVFYNFFFQPYGFSYDDMVITSLLLEEQSENVTISCAKNKRRKSTVYGFLRLPRTLVLHLTTLKIHTLHSWSSLWLEFHDLDYRLPWHEFLRTAAKLSCLCYFQSNPKFRALWSSLCQQQQEDILVSEIGTQDDSRVQDAHTMSTMIPREHSLGDLFYPQTQTLVIDVKLVCPSSRVSLCVTNRQTKERCHISLRRNGRDNFGRFIESSDNKNTITTADCTSTVNLKAASSIICNNIRSES